jgi:hypothetical protein
MMLHSSLLSLLCFLGALSLVTAQTPALYRINTNGPAFTDSSNGNQWAADDYFVIPGLTYANSGLSIDTSAPGTTDGLLYQTERYKDDVQYSFPGESSGIERLRMSLKKALSHTSLVRSHSSLTSHSGQWLVLVCAALCRNLRFGAE